jgi:hypothetical protein
MDYKEFAEKYKPIMNKYGYELFDTHGEDYEFVKSNGQKNVWTYLSDDILVPGIRYINRLGYIVCENQWSDENETVDY